MNSFDNSYLSASRYFIIITILLLFLLVLSRPCGCLPVDNGVEGEPEIVCSEGSIGAKFRTRNAFEGHIFVKGHFADNNCRTDETGQTTAAIHLPFSACGVRRIRSASPKGIFVDMTIIISFHPQFVTKVDRAYTIQCYYMETEKSVSAELEVSMLTTIFQKQIVQMPVCRYDVLQESANGAAVKFARVGDRVYHKWQCDTESIHSCFVNDGTGEQIQLLDAQGCALDKYLLNNLEYLGDLMAGRESHVFKYADKSSIFFNCQINLSVKEPGAQCARPSCPEPQRGKRGLVNVTESPDQNFISYQRQSTAAVDVNSEMITIMDLEAAAQKPTTETPTEELASAVSSLSFSSEYPWNSFSLSKNRVCMTMISLATFVSVSLAVLLTLLSLILCLYRRIKSP